MKFPKIFYGWWIVGAVFIIALYTSSTIFYGFTAMFEPIIDEFSWSHAQLSFAASLRGLEEGFLVLVMGIFVDRWGPRRFVLGGAILIAVGFALLGNIHSLGAFYGVYAIIGLGRSAISGAVMVTAIVNWFRTKAGVASGFALTGFSAIGLLAPAIVKIVDSYGWRDASTIFAVGLLVIVLPLSLLIRHRPEPYGYSPDGVEKSTPLSPAIEEVNPIEVNLTLKQALSSRAFWQITLAHIFMLTAIFAVFTHVLPYLSSIGVERSTSGILMILLSVFAIISRIGFGFAFDRFNKRIVTVASFATLIFAMLCMAYASASSIVLVIIGLILLGIGWGCNAVLRVTQVRETFGRKKFATIMGLITGIAAIVGMAGPPFAGWVFDNWQNYQGAWLIFAGVTFLGVISTLTLPNKSKPSPISE